MPCFRFYKTKRNPQTMDGERELLLSSSHDQKKQTTYVTTSHLSNTGFQGVSIESNPDTDIPELRRSVSMGELVEPITLCWNGVNVFVKMEKKKFYRRKKSDGAEIKQILRNGKVFWIFENCMSYSNVPANQTVIFLRQSGLPCRINNVKRKNYFLNN